MRPVLLASLLVASCVYAQDNTRFMVSRDSVPTYINEPGSIGMTILLDEASTGSDVGFSLGTFLPGANVAEHVHEGVAELLCIMSGEMELVIDGATVIAREGSAVYIPPDVPHSAQVLSGIEPVKVIQVYSPGGAEQRFKDWRTE